MEKSQSVFTITPMSKKINLEPGETYTGTIKVLNPVDAEGNFSYMATVAPYSVEGQSYDADLSTETERSRILDWITIENPRGTLAPNEHAEINFTITVPEDAAGGGQYAAIMVGSDNTRNSSEGINIQNEYEMASVIYAKIAGDIIRDGSILENNVPGFVTNLPMTMNVLVENKGNIHETAKIDVSVKSMIGNVQVYPKTGESGEIQEVIMPETSHNITRDISDISPLGIYEVYQTVTYLGQTSTTAKVVVACPVWFMAMILIVVTLIISGIVWRVKKHRQKRNLAKQ